MLLVETLITPIFGVLFNYSTFNFWLIPVVLLGTLGFAEIGTIFAAMAINTRAREVLLPVLFFPIMLPVIIAAANATSAVLANRPFDEVLGQLEFMAVFDIIFLVLPILLFELAVEE
jgi:heme exporter protein B